MPVVFQFQQSACLVLCADSPGFNRNFTLFPAAGYCHLWKALLNGLLPPRPFEPEI
jgi:hypothetical protein